MIKSCTEDLVYDVYMHWFKNWTNIIFHHSLVSYDFKGIENIFQMETIMTCAGVDSTL